MTPRERRSSRKLYVLVLIFASKAPSTFGLTYLQLLSGNRRGEARSALREVQARHNEIQRIEKTIIELADLFNQMEQMVEEQETMVEVIDQRGEEIQTNVEQAQEQIGQAVEKARSRRRKKWWCLLVVRKFTLAISCFLPLPLLPRPQFGLSFLLASVPGIPFPYRASHAQEITYILEFWEDSSHHHRRGRGRCGGHANAEEMKTLPGILDIWLDFSFLYLFFIPYEKQRKEPNHGNFCVTI